MLPMVRSMLHANALAPFIDQVHIQQTLKTTNLRAHSLLQVLRTIGHVSTAHVNRPLLTRPLRFNSPTHGDLLPDTSFRIQTHTIPCLHTSHQFQNQNPDHSSPPSMVPTHRWILHLPSEPVPFLRLLPTALCAPTQTSRGLQTIDYHPLVQMMLRPQLVQDLEEDPQPNLCRAKSR